MTGQRRSSFTAHFFAVVKEALVQLGLIQTNPPLPFASAGDFRATARAEVLERSASSHFENVAPMCPQSMKSPGRCWLNGKPADAQDLSANRGSRSPPRTPRPIVKLSAKERFGVTAVNSIEEGLSWDPEVVVVDAAGRARAYVSWALDNARERLLRSRHMAL